MRKLLAILFSLPLIAGAQNAARFDLPVLMTTPGQVAQGSQPPLLAVTNATVTVCGYPAVMSGAACTNTITTYTDSSLTTACPSTAQLTAPGSSACISTSGLQGAFGFWYNASANNHLTYTVQSAWGNYGPYDIAPGSSSGGTGTVTGVSAGNLSPLFNTQVANPTTNPSLTFTPTPFSPHVFYGNNGGSTANPTASLIGASDWSPNAYAAGSGSAQDQTVTLVPAPTALTPGLEVRWLPIANNTGASPTLNVDSLGPRPVTKNGAASLVAGDLTTAAVADAIYDGNHWQLQNPQTTTGGGGGSCAQGTCVVTAPSASQTLLQPAGTQFYTNILNGSYIASMFQTPPGTGNNGIANAVTQACGTAGCDIRVPENYAANEIPSGYQRAWINFQSPQNTMVEDRRNGVLQFAFHSPGSSAPASISGVKIITDYDRFPSSTATYGGYVGSSGSLNLRTSYFTGLRNTQNNYGGVPTFQYGGYHQGIYNELDTWDSGQSFNRYNVLNCYGTGDCIGNFEAITFDGGVNGIDDQGQQGFDQTVSENPNVYTGTITNAVSAGATTIATNCTTGCGNEWPGQDRLLIDTASAKTITGVFGVGYGAPSGNIPPTVSDPSANYPVSTFVLLCYAGSDNGAGGAAGCPAGGTPSGYIPPQQSSPSEEQPAASIPTSVLASFSGTPSGFCTNSTLQSSNSSGACYMPASGVGCLADQNYFESVNYTYNSATQQVTLTNLQFVHSNAMVFATGGLCNYAAEVAADIWTQPTGGSGVQSQIFPIVGSISPTTFYYAPVRTNEGYGPAILGISTDQASSSNAQTSFSTQATYFSANGTTVTMNINGPANTLNPFPKYDHLAVNISTGNSTYNCASCALTWQGNNTYTYTLGTAPSGTVPTSGTVSFSNMQYTLYPAAQILSAYDSAGSQVDGTVTVMPNTVNWAQNDPIRVPHFQQVSANGLHELVTQFLPQQYIGQNINDFTIYGNMAPGASLLNLSNNNVDGIYQGFGGTRLIPYYDITIGGMFQNDIHLIQPPQSAIITVDSCKYTIGCSSPQSNFNLFQGPPLPNAFPGLGIDALVYDPDYNVAGRPQGLTSGRFVFGPYTADGQPATGQTSATTVESGYFQADQGISTASISSANIFSTQLTNYPGNSVNVIGPTGSTAYTYYIVGHGTAGGVTMPYAASISNGPATLSSSNANLICMFLTPGFGSFDVLKGNTSTLLGTAVPGNGGTYGQPPFDACIEDTGQATSAYVAPVANTTGAAQLQGPLTANSVTTTGSSNGNLNLTATGTAPSSPAANTIQVEAPSTVTAYGLVLPSGPPTGSNTIMSCTAATISVCSWAANAGGGATLGANTFTGTQTMPAMAVTSTGTPVANSAAIGYVSGAGTVIGIGANSTTIGNVALTGYSSDGSQSKNFVTCIGNGGCTFNQTAAFLAITVNFSAVTVNCSTSGSVQFKEPEQGTAHKLVEIYENACVGTATWNIVAAFTYTPQIISQSLTSTVTSLSASSVTITGSTSTGFVALDGF